MDITRIIPDDQYKALLAATNPSATNPFATQADLGGTTLGWKPPTITLGDFITNGVTSYLALGVGHLVTFDPNQDDDLRLNIGLNKDGVPYDGSPITFHLHWEIYSSPGGGTKNVLWNLDYAFTKDGDAAYVTIDNVLFMDINVSGRTPQVQYTDSFTPISGPVGSDVLQITLRRNATSDSYNGDVDLYGVNLT